MVLICSQVIFRTTFLLLIVVTIAGCDFVWSSSDICDCRFRPSGEEQEWHPLDQAPANYRPSEIRRRFDNDSPVYGTPEIFDSANIHWYRNESGVTAACVVFESSKRMNAAFYLSADQSVADPVDFRILGIPLGWRERFFWEGCDDFSPGAARTQ